MGYVDDVLALFEGTIYNITKLFTYINTINPNIQFTHRNNHSIQLLDLKITRSTSTTFLSLETYRKP